MSHQEDPESMPLAVDLSSLRLSDEEAAALLERVRKAARAPSTGGLAWWGFTPRRTRQIAMVAGLTALAEAACLMLLPSPEPPETVTQLLESAALSGRKLSPRDVYLASLVEKP